MKRPEEVLVTNQVRGFPGSGTHGKLDTETGALLGMEFETHMINKGSSFTSAYTVELANSAVIDILIVTPNTTKWAHMQYALLSELETDLKFYEDTVTTGDGTGLAEYNKNRNSAVTATTVVSYTPTVAGGAEGTLLRNKHFGSGKTTCGDTRALHEWVLKQNAKYMLRITNATTSVNWVTIILDWYEHTNA